MDNSTPESKVFDAIRQLSFLDPKTEHSVPMPLDVWARIEERLASESQVVPISKHSRRKYWISGLAAASLVILASTAYMAGGGQSSPTVEGLGAIQSDVVVDPPTLPVRQVLTSGTHYTRADLPRQVASLLTRAGISATWSTDSLTQEPLERLTSATSGFTSTLASLQACVNILDPIARTHPILVDLGDLDGTPVGLLLSLSPNGVVRVTVVPLSCGQTTKNSSAIVELNLER